ncbi:hypothetical protein JM654_07555 [Microbacterium oxydans]|nr:hypothetical protein [Microbacterium oxydans]
MEATSKPSPARERPTGRVLREQLHADLRGALFSRDPQDLCEQIVAVRVGERLVDDEVEEEELVVPQNQQERPDLPLPRP